MGNQAPQVLFLFLDGVGIGKKNPQINPFFASRLPVLRSLLNGNIPHLRDSRFSSTHASLRPINATLRVEGLPQSGTGQTALLTGVNAAKLIGKHFGPYPYSTLKPVIREQNIFKQLAERGKSVFYANAFPPRFFEYINSPKTRTTAIAMSWMSSGFALNTHDVLAKGEALSADITSEGWNKMGFPAVPSATPQEAGQRLATLTEKYNFILFEFYLTDHIGHKQSMEEAIQILERYDSFLEGILSAIDFNKTLILLTSDHGNLEDLSTKTHTRNPVPLLTIGEKHREVSASIKSLVDVTPAILNLFK